MTTILATKDQIISAIHTLEQSIQSYPNDLPFVMLCQKTIETIKQDRSAGILVDRLSDCLQAILGVSRAEARECLDCTISENGDQVIYNW